MSRIAPIILGLLLLTTNAFAADALPRVLILGDTIYNGVSRSVATELKGKAQVVWVRAGDTSDTLANLDKLLGDAKWDVIHFNLGLADLHYKDPATKTIRAMSKYAGGVRVTTKEQYEKNLRELVKRLQATQARLIWASTTPITSSQFDNIYDPGSEVEFNSIAARIMAEHKVPLNDIHAFVLESRGDKKAQNPLDFKGIELHRPIISVIQNELAKAATANR